MPAQTSLHADDVSRRKHALHFCVNLRNLSKHVGRGTPLLRLCGAGSLGGTQSQDTTDICISAGARIKTCSPKNSRGSPRVAPNGFLAMMDIIGTKFSADICNTPASRFRQPKTQTSRPACCAGSDGALKDTARHVRQIHSVVTGRISQRSASCINEIHKTLMLPQTSNTDQAFDQLNMLRISQKQNRMCIAEKQKNVLERYVTLLDD
ncbi:uncharacterized protein LACBIDRAFT_322625 [Laccaria bicolor S238N-H82]|uniref:Predicted protein n=1 Tax=Laccaria bicolor (strain S238N-H82 / ATCC MYA-4686) TaxID=486041 RepID=B0CWZ1_LACBS|nr:uncharacterized protein LACBIDRAFT_322625 [Laccaria bicolor S238N-H82]EDR13592.1 predicted protein [Laccaria bicolor S238N-H82]|eukprot:XP_001876090.1 predicted protein [Laccaria bicolor S238N-H82]